MFRGKVFGAFSASESIATVGFLGGEELAWYGNVLVLLGEEGWDEALEGWRRCAKSWTAGPL